MKNNNSFILFFANECVVLKTFSFDVTLISMKDFSLLFLFLFSFLRLNCFEYTGKGKYVCVCVCVWLFLHCCIIAQAFGWKTWIIIFCLYIMSLRTLQVYFCYTCKAFLLLLNRLIEWRRWNKTFQQNA